MKDIKEFFESNIIFGNIIYEAKETLSIVGKTFDEWIKDLPNDKGEAEASVISGVPTEDRFRNKVVVTASTSLLSGLKFAKKELENTQTYSQALVVIPFENVYICAQFKYNKDGNIGDCGIYAVKPKLLSIKSILNISKSVFEVYERIYLKSGKPSDKELIDSILKYVNKNNFVNEVNNKYGDAAQEADAKSKEPTPDKSPFTLRKKKQFPEYLKHCIIYEKDNAIVKKYSYWGEAEIFVETIKKDKKNYYKVYMGDVRSSFDNGHDEMYTFYLTTLGSLDKFLEYCLKPNRKKMHSELGADGEIHVWYSNMQKNLSPALKKDCIKDENLIKELKFHDFELNDLYK